MNKLLSLFLKIFVAPLVGLLLIKKVSGKENMPKGNFIMASNHQSYFDIVVCGYVCVPRAYVHIGQVDRKNKGWKFIRDALYSIGQVIPVNRNDEDSKKWAFAKSIEYLKRGYSLIIYPEGTRTRTGEVQQGKWGVAKMYLQTGVPVLPIGISGAFDIFPPGGKIKIRKNIEVAIGRPMQFLEQLERSKGLAQDSEEYKNICIDITNKVMSEIKNLVHVKRD